MSIGNNYIISSFPKMLNSFDFKNKIMDLKSSSSYNVDKKMVEKCWKHMDKLVKICQDPKLNLKHSPPYIIDIIPDTYKHMKLIQTTYDNKWSQLTSNQYFTKFLHNLLTKVQSCATFMSSNEPQIYNEESEARSEFTKLCLIFSHIFTELKALFPEGHYVGDSYRVTKNDAHTWWKKTFKDRTIVTWDEFFQQLSEVHPISHIEQTTMNKTVLADRLKQTIDLTHNDHISIFEFDVFTRLFQPWHCLLHNWYVLAVTHPGYGAFLTYDEVKGKLASYKSKPGSYIYRLSCTRLGQWAIGYVTKEGSILQTIPLNKSLGQALLEGEKAKYYLYPNGGDKNPNIRMLAEAISSNHIAVTEEQYDIYCGMGSSFEQCKICTENDKDVRIEPCGHLLCTACLLHWQSNSGATCPFCRSVIKGTEPIIIDHFRNTKQPSPPSPPFSTNWGAVLGLSRGASDSPLEDQPPPPPNPRGTAPQPNKNVLNHLKVKNLSESLGAVGGALNTDNGVQTLSPPVLHLRRPSPQNTPNISPLMPRRHLPPVPTQNSSLANQANNKMSQRNTMFLVNLPDNFADPSESKSLPEDAVRISKDDNNIIYSLSKSMDDPPPIPLRRNQPNNRASTVLLSFHALMNDPTLGSQPRGPPDPLIEAPEVPQAEKSLIVVEEDDQAGLLAILVKDGYPEGSARHALEMAEGKLDVARVFLGDMKN